MEKTTALPVFDTTAPYNIKREYYKTGFECFQKKFIACNDGKVLRIQICQTDDEEERIPESRVVMATAYVQEFDEFYLVCDEKKMFYILPKSALASPAAELPEEVSAESGADSEA